MFEESLVESTTLLRTRNRWPVTLALAAQTLLALVALTIPLLHPERLPLAAARLSLTPPVLRPAPPPPRPQVLQHLTQTSSAAPAFTAPAFIAPASQASRAPHLTSDLPPLDLGAAAAVALATGGRSLPGAVLGPGPSTPSVRVEPSAPPKATAPLRISSGVSAGLLLSPIRPVYPALAQQIRVSGTVVVEAIISPTGHIENARVLSGPALLQAAALEAVRSARYRPYTLNGQPTTVATTFSINFRLGD